MADVNKYNDLSSQGNIYGPLVQSEKITSNNGRTPVNPAAVSPKPMLIDTFKGVSTTVKKDPTQRA
jgi:hypothetical protein